MAKYTTDPAHRREIAERLAYQYDTKDRLVAEILRDLSNDSYESSTMLHKLVNYSVPAGTDSCDQPMRKVRAALIDEARALISKATGGA